MNIIVLKMINKQRMKMLLLEILIFFKQRQRKRELISKDLLVLIA